MGVARHNDGFVGFRLFRNGAQKRLNQRHHGVNLGAEIHPQVQGHLVVPGTGSVELFSHVSQTVRQNLLHKHMDILTGHVEGERPGIQVIQNPLEAFNQGLGLGLFDNALGSQHGGVGHGACDILGIHPAVEGDGGIEVVRNCVHIAGCPSGPQLCHSDFPFYKTGGASPSHAEIVWITVFPVPAGPGPWWAGPRG